MGVFCTLPTTDIEAISGLIPIHLHLKKLYSRFHFRESLLPLNHIVKSIINTDKSNDHTKHCLFLNSLTPKQVSHLNSPLINIDNRYNEFLLSFSLFNKESFPGNCLIDIFPDCFFFNPWTHDVKNHLYRLNDITIQTSYDSLSSIVISDISIKNHTITLISHTHLYNSPIIKMCHHTINISTTEAKIFVIRYGINQAVGIPHINHIIVITDFNTCHQDNFWFIITSIPNLLSCYIW